MNEILSGGTTSEGLGFSIDIGAWGGSATRLSNTKIYLTHDLSQFDLSGAQIIEATYPGHSIKRVIAKDNYVIHDLGNSYRVYETQQHDYTSGYRSQDIFKPKGFNGVVRATADFTYYNGTSDTFAGPFVTIGGHAVIVGLSVSWVPADVASGNFIPASYQLHIGPGLGAYAQLEYWSGGPESPSSTAPSYGLYNSILEELQYNYPTLTPEMVARVYFYKLQETAAMYAFQPDDPHPLWQPPLDPYALLTLESESLHTALTAAEQGIFDFSELPDVQVPPNVIQLTEAQLVEILALAAAEAGQTHFTVNGKSYDLNELVRGDELSDAAKQDITTALEKLENPFCFAPGTLVAVGKGQCLKIEELRVGDSVMAFDAGSNPVQGETQPRRVTQTHVNTADHLLDVAGLKVTPGHVFLCGDGPNKGSFEPLIDIIRRDGALVKDDGSLVRPSVDAPVGSDADRPICVLYLTDPDGDPKPATLRAGTRLFLADEEVTVAEILEDQGYELTGEGLVARDGEAPEPLHWFGIPPKPEDYILAKSGLTLDELYHEVDGVTRLKAGEPVH